MRSALADEHVPTAITIGLRRRGMDVVTAQELALEGTVDDKLLEIALAQGRLMITSDQDFFEVHARWLREGRKHAGIVFWRPARHPVGQIIRHVLEIAQEPTETSANDLHYVR